MRVIDAATIIPIILPFDADRTKDLADILNKNANRTENFIDEYCK